MPSMPMLTMPDRSHHRPVIAPSAIGVASTSDSSIRFVTLVPGASDRARPIVEDQRDGQAAATSWATSAMRSNRCGRKLSAPATIHSTPMTATTRRRVELDLERVGRRLEREDASARR